MTMEIYSKKHFIKNVLWMSFKFVQKWNIMCSKTNVHLFRKESWPATRYCM